MSENGRPKSKLGKLEALLWVAGVGMLGAFFLIRGAQDTSSAAGIEAFEQARATAVDASAKIDRGNIAQAADLREGAPRLADPIEVKSEAQQKPTVRPVMVLSSESVLDPVPEPDFSDWSEKRISEYQESLEGSSAIPLAVLSIDSLDIKVPVYDGASDLNLNRGVARIRGTARINEIDNLGIAGHRDGFFRGLQHISVGDPIDLDTLNGPVRYRVTGITIVNPEDVYVLDPTESRTLTLVTCYPFYFVGSAPQRYIVTAEAETLQVQS